MEPLPFRIEIYVARNGKVPFSRWLNDLADARGRAKIRLRIDRLRLGSFGDCKPVGDGVHELRVDFGPGYRVYFGRTGKAGRAALVWRRQEHSIARRGKGKGILG